MRITLNLATRPFTDLGPALKRLRIGMAVLGALCLLFLLGLHLFDRQAAEVRAREHSLDGQIARIEAERQHAQAYMKQPDNAQLLTQAEFLNERFDEKAFSWTLAMEAMETVLPAGVQVTSIEPQRTKEGQITVELRVLGPHDQSVNLVRNLERSRRFIDPRIEGESAESSNGPNSRIEVPVSPSNRFEFELFADYNPPTPEERAVLNTRASKKAAASPVAPGRVPALARAPTSHLGMPPPLSHQRGRPPYTGPAQFPPQPAPNTNGGRP
ncbi:MAG: fimbrial assembly protein [Terracidiphilus sp.]|jgi:type IV pilus assembly protein PilN